MQKQSKRNDMEIGLRRLELIRAALSVTRDLLCSTDDNTAADRAAYIRGWLASQDIDWSELTSLYEDISCRIKTIKEMETL